MSSQSKSRGPSRTSLKSARSSGSSVNQTLKDSAPAAAEQGQPAENPRKSETKLSFVPWRIFVNHIDSYHGKKLSESLPGRVYVVDTREVGEFDDAPVAGGVDAYSEIEDEEETGMKRKRQARARGSEGDDIAEREENREEQINLSQGRLETARRKFEVIGTVRDEKYERPENVAMVIRSTKNKELFLGELMKCGVVIYDITQDDSQIAEARWALEAIVEELTKARLEAPKAFERNRDVRYFVLISTVLTWALTKPLDPKDPDQPFTEADYRKRKPHPNFKEHIKCEREVSTIAKRTDLSDKLKTLVVGSGVTYGDEEGPLHYLFKMAWNNAESLPIFGRGTNKIPLLHVRDLAELVGMLVKKWPDKKKKYIVAVEQELLSQNSIVKKISKALATGKVEHVAREEAFLLPEVTQRSYDMICANVNIEPAYIIDNELRWHWETPTFRDNVDALIREYITSRNLLPVKIVVLGPPASGKTKLARSLAKHYGVHYINVKELITNTVQKLTNEIEAIASVPDVGKRNRSTEEQINEEEEDEEEEEDDDEDEEDSRDVEDSRQLLDEIRNGLAENNGRLDDDILNKIFLKRLASKDCQNQGYVIDGYPKTLAQAVSLFGSSEDDEEAEEDESDFPDAANRKIIPDLVVVLEASDEFLIERVVRLPEKEIQNTHYNEEGMLRRLKEYRERNTDDESPNQFFDELELHPLVINIENDICPEMFSTFVQCIRRLGEPKNYGPSDAEREEAKKRVEAEALAASVIEAARKEREDFERKTARERKMMEWTDLAEKLKQEEEEQLCVAAEPLRHYLVKYIFPTLTQGLVEVARLRPEDPIDFLAEYLFKENPEGKMFEPDYTETMSMLLDAIEKLQEDVLPGNELDKGAERYLKGVGRQFDRAAAARRIASKDEAAAESTDEEEEEDRDDNYDDYDRCGQNGAGNARSDCVVAGGVVSSISTATRGEKSLTYAEDADAMIASSFSYDEMAEGSRKSFGNSSILSREDAR